MVADHVTSITNSVELIVEQIPLKFGEMKSFKVITPYSYYDMIYNVENWPDNVLVKRFGYSNKNNKSSVKNETSGIKKNTVVNITELNNDNPHYNITMELANDDNNENLNQAGEN